MPTDFSRGAGQALRHAVVLADRLGAELHLLHVVTGPISVDGGMIRFPEMEQFCAGMRAEASRYHLGLLEPRQEDDLSMRCTVQRHTEAARAILEYAGDHQIDLIVLAPYGSSQGGRFVVGSTAEKVVRLAPCDVLTSGLRGLYRPDVLKRILVPVDFSPQSALALERARILTKQARAHLTVLHVGGTTVFPGERPGVVTVEARKSHEKAHADLEAVLSAHEGAGRSTPFLRDARTTSGSYCDLRGSTQHPPHRSGVSRALRYRLRDAGQRGRGRRAPGSMPGADGQDAGECIGS